MADLCDVNDLGGVSFDDAEPIENGPPDQWPALCAFGDLDLPPCPVDVVPEPLRSFAIALSVATQTPVDLATMLGIAALAACVPPRTVVNPRPDWIEPVCVFIAVVLPPGSRKSAVFGEVTRPIVKWESRKADEMSEQIARERSDLNCLIARQKEVTKKASRTKEKDERQNLNKEAQDLAVEIAVATAELSVIPSVFTDDVTPEALATGIKEQDGRYAVMSAEGGGPLDTLAGRYSSGVPNFDVYLKGHAGDTLKVSRKGSEPVFVEQPALTLGLTIQPDVVRAIANVPGARGRGLPARFGFCWPKNTVGRRKVDPPPVPDRLARKWAGLLTRLLDQTAPPADELIEIKFDSEARQILEEYMREIEPMLAPGGELGTIVDWGSKLVGLVVRIAGLFSIVETMNREVRASQVRAAIEVAQYLKEHALAAFGEMLIDEDTARARHVLAYLTDREIDRFRVRDLFTNLGKGMFPKTQTLQDAIDILEARGYVRLLPAAPVGPQGGRPQSSEYQVRPQDEPTGGIAGSAGSSQGREKKREEKGIQNGSLRAEPADPAEPLSSPRRGNLEDVWASWGGPEVTP